MITEEQIKELSEYFHIDRPTIFREYLQLVFLSHLYGNKKSDKIYFKGGTAIHIVYGSPRFSEDLDFSTTYAKKEIKDIINEVMKDIRTEFPELEIFSVYSGKKGVRMRIKYQTDKFKYPFVVRLDFSQENALRDIEVAPVVSKFPIILFPLVACLSREEVLAEKIRALLTRGKGRDIFDVWFLIEKGAEIDMNLISKKLRFVGKSFSKKGLIKTIKNYPDGRIKLDLPRFLPSTHRRIVGILKSALLKHLVD